jgi:transposase-like protein
MGRAIGPRKVHRYSVEFKQTAVKLSQMPGVQVQTVAAGLDIHPFMLSRWRKEAQDGLLKGRPQPGPARGATRARTPAAASAGARARAPARGA